MNVNKLFLSIVCFLSLYSLAEADCGSKTVRLRTEDNVQIEADFYQSGTSAVILAHGAVFNKESWKKTAGFLCKNKFSVLSINFRGYGESENKNISDRKLDIVAAIKFLQKNSKKISVLAASMGAAVTANALSDNLNINSLVLLSPSPKAKYQDIQASKVIVIAGKAEKSINKIKENFDLIQNKSKQLVLLDSNQHAQNMLRMPTIREKAYKYLLDFLS